LGNKSESQLNYKKIDPLKHMSKIAPDIDKIAPDDEKSDVTPFKDIEDSAVYIRKLRKDTWRR